MNTLGYLISGGFAKGYRTYILAGVGLITVGAQFAVGDLSLTEALQQGALALGLGTLRAAQS
jgi:hypothetical protein